MFYYAGIGSRQTPEDILKLMTVMASVFCSIGVCLRSGGALGADLAFEQGVNNNALKDIYYASDATSDSFALSSRYHGGWNSLDSYSKKLHGRNAQILLGRDLQLPVGFIVCWTPGGKVSGGTGQALRISVDYGIPVYNLADDCVVTALCSVLGIDLSDLSVRYQIPVVKNEQDWLRLLKDLSDAVKFEKKVSEGKSIMQRFKKL